jgi:hypothetical protein
MTPETPSTPEPQPAGISELSRVTGVYFEPAKTFEDIARRPSFWVPLLLIILCGMAVTFTISSRVGWERAMRHQLEMSPRVQQMTPEQREQVVQMQARFAGVGGFAFVLIGLPIYYAIVAGILLGITAIMNAGIKYKQMYAIMVYSSLPGLISGVLTIVVLFLKNPDDFNLSNPLAFNPGALMDPTSSSKFVYSLASSLDLFVFWTIFLIATGIKAAAGKKISFGGALAAVTVPWAIWIVGKAAIAGAFG